jgi:hypothetical protein
MVALFSFDVGWEIDLGRLQRLLPESGRAPDRQGPPERVRYPTPPLVLREGTRTVALAGRRFAADVVVRAHEFGAVTVMLELPNLTADVGELPALTARLAGEQSLEDEARRVLAQVLPRLAPAIARPNADGARRFEDYYVLQVSRFEPVLDAATLLDAHGALLARALHCEEATLGESETAEVLRTAVTYTPEDLVVTDWNVALVYDREYGEVLDVLELLNVQLLELRSLDAMLDRAIGDLYGEIARGRSLFSFRREAARARSLAELRLDTAALRERMVNAMKLVGDLYLTKVYARTAERLHLGEWQRGLDGKLEVVQKISDVFATRAATTRAELLELAIIVLIALDIVVYFAR